ncbi:PH-9 domain-containing protein [Fusarium sp. LHS14.1]|nr:PH-9 domain-containing protein [Fusarium sp. LHS14.1]
MFVAESTAFSTTIKTGASTIFTEDTEDSDYESDGALTPKEPKRTPRNSIDRDDRNSIATPGISRHGFDTEQNRAGDKIQGQRSVRFEDGLTTPGASHEIGLLDETVGSIEDSSGSSEGRMRSNNASLTQRLPPVDEELFYKRLIQSRPRQPPSYEAAITLPQDTLPEYHCDIDLEGVFMRKIEITDTTQRAEDRQWRMVYVTLHGTALNIYGVKKSWQWGRTRDDGPSVDPDNPPWINQGKLLKSYSLQYAESGIASDYKKRRYVIRLRVETDQFLISSCELSTFVKWLDWLNAAINVAAPIEDRDFPFDYSVTRIERIRLIHGRERIPPAFDLDFGELFLWPLSTTTRGVSNSSETLDPNPPVVESSSSRRWGSFSSLDLDDSINPVTGKWFPQCRWSSAHDMLYAKLCYSNLLFKSPRKSSYVISSGKKWFVDWSTGRMVRVLPPAYEEVDYFGPWQVVHTENGRI